jgi:hypothetical protein
MFVDIRHDFIPLTIDETMTASVSLARESRYLHQTRRPAALQGRFGLYCSLKEHLVRLEIHPRQDEYARPFLQAKPLTPHQPSSNRYLVAESQIMVVAAVKKLTPERNDDINWTW